MAWQLRSRSDDPAVLTKGEQLAIAFAHWHPLGRRVQALVALRSGSYRLTNEDRAELGVAESVVAEAIEKVGSVRVGEATYRAELGQIKASLPW